VTYLKSDSIGACVKGAPRRKNRSPPRKFELQVKRHTTFVALCLAISIYVERGQLLR